MKYAIKILEQQRRSNINLMQSLRHNNQNVKDIEEHNIQLEQAMELLNNPNAFADVVSSFEPTSQRFKNGFNVGRCKCNYIVLDRESYCPKCGTKLDWKA